MTQPQRRRIRAFGLAIWVALAGCRAPLGTLIASARFAAVQSAREGAAQIYRANGALTLHLRDVPRGPDLELRLVGTDPSSGFLVAARLGGSDPLLVELPPCTDVARYRAVAIWDRARQTVRASAPLVHYAPGDRLP